MNRLWQPSPTRKQLRDFGLVVGSALVVLGIVSAWRHPERSVHSYLLALGAVLLLTGVIMPRVLKLPYQLWMALAFVLGAVMTNVILTITFFVAFTFVGLIMRLARRDPLEIAWRPGKQRSYWREREILHIQNRHLRPF